MRVRLKDIAADLGVSVVTVSKVLRDKRDISEQTRAMVLKRMQELNYQPNMLARGLAGGRSHTIGLIVPDLVHPFFGQFAKALGTALRVSNQALILASSEEDPAIERQEITTLLNRGVDALLIASCQNQTTEGLQFSREGTPYLLIDRNFPQLKANFIGSNDVQVGEVATQHLLSLGRKRIGHIGSLGSSPSIDRVAGYKSSLASAGLAADPKLIVTRERIEDTGDAIGYLAMRQLLTQLPRPDAVFCYNDLTALGAMKAATEAGLRIPEQIAFVGCGNLRYAEYLRFPLTSVDHQTETMGQLAAKRALHLVEKPENGSEPETKLLEPKLIVRGSSVSDASSAS